MMKKLPNSLVIHTRLELTDLATLCKYLDQFSELRPYLSSNVRQGLTILANTIKIQNPSTTFDDPVLAYRYLESINLIKKAHKSKTILKMLSSESQTTQTAETDTFNEVMKQLKETEGE